MESGNCNQDIADVFVERKWLLALGGAIYNIQKGKIFKNLRFYSLTCEGKTKYITIPSTKTVK